MKNAETKIDFVESDGGHWYKSLRKADTYYPSVTTILSIYPKGVGFNKYLAAQSSWENSQQILQDAGRRGTRVHQATQLLEEGHELLRDSFSLEEWEMLMGFASWWHEMNPIIKEIEISLVDEKLQTGGTIDRVYEIDGLITVLDIKTSNSIHGNYWVQAATYAEMYERKHKKIQIDQIAILRLTDRKKARYEYETMTREEWKSEFEIFKNLKSVWHHLNPKAKPKIFEVPTTLKLTKQDIEVDTPKELIDVT